jgi:hypothetical protein
VTDEQIRAVVRAMHPDIILSDFDLRVMGAVAKAAKEQAAKIAEMPNMAPKDIARAIRNG